MGKLGPRLASRKKAKRWAKGQSSSSNPETTKYRQQAAGIFFKVLPSGTPGITKEDLQKHDAMQGIEPQIAKLGIDEAKDPTESTAMGTSVKTFDTFASSYSNCSNLSFSRFLEHFQSNSILHKEMLAVLSAVTDVIQQNGGAQTSTEYFAALMSTLEAVEDDTSVAATVSLLGMGLKAVPRNVLNSRFGATSQVLLQILSRYAVTENSLILRHCIGCLSVLLRAQEAAVWTELSTIQVLDAVLSFTTHAKPKVRKSAQHAIRAMLKGSDIMKSEKPPSHHPAAAHVAQHCVAAMNAACEPGGITTILHVLSLLKDVAHQFPRSHVKSICEGLLRIMTLKNALTTSCCLQTLHGLFVSRPSEASLPAQRNAQIITALYDYQPPASDGQPTLAWLAVMQEAHCNLARCSLSLCAAVLPRMLEKCAELWLADKADVITGTSHVVKTMLQECVAPLCEDETRGYDSTLRQVVATMRKALSYQYLGAWHHVLHLVAVLFRTVGERKPPGLVEIVRSLGELRDSHNFAHNSDAEYAIGAAIRAMGPRAVLEVLPLHVHGDAVDLRRGWLIPLMKDCITGGSISFFTECLLPVAQLCEQKARREPVNSKTYEFLVPQIWSILPSICSDASDVSENFKGIAQKLGMIINQRKELRLPVLAALRRLIVQATQSEKTADTGELARFAKNYLPILFNLYTTRSCGTDEEGQRLAAFDTVKVYLTIASKELANELFDRALSKLSEPAGTDDFAKESIYDLIRVLIGYTDADRLKGYYDMCVPFLRDDGKQKEQKKAYRFLEEVCGSDREGCKSFLEEHRREIQKMLMSTATSVIKTSRGPRLKCLIHLVKRHPQLERTKFLDAVLPEAVLAVKDVNQKCRSTAYQLLNVIAEKFLDRPGLMREYTSKLTVGIAGGDKYCSATLLALASLTYNYESSLSPETIQEIVEFACTILTSSTRETVESALSYLKVYLGAVPRSTVQPMLPKIVRALSDMKEDCHRHFRQKMRDVISKLIRNYGVTAILELLPSGDVLLRKRLNSINKIEKTKCKRREEKWLKRKAEREKVDNDFNVKRRPKSIEEILADSDEEFEATESEEPKKNKKRTSRKEAWIQENEENIVDLIDPAAARNITTTQPGLPNPKVSGKKVKDQDFKIAPDGRFIITDSNERDSDVEGKKKKRKKTPFPQEDSNDDWEGDSGDDGKDEDDARMTKTARKRKHNDVDSDVISLKSQSTSKYQTGGSGIHRPLKTRKVEDVLPGSEFRTTKAGGDMKKKGKPDPYAYLPLTRAVLNKRKKKKNAGKFQSIVSGAKKGARIGMKNKRKKH
ncbi:PREDICTED: RRP12-like protein isoform X2 [Dinoponera quadriceps]|nr:PREDICTED: RRP12-like protein isoform X2 [Dinoponera quadriceps]XP_014485128.1 PREDICTED: RRP12-like protein isoform X2 [Dinoponera quadriceps]XP_014485129.1 PREDICTED: RRP12-like protein isoform X2 [Dinoponera quadriceps]